MVIKNRNKQELVKEKKQLQIALEEYNRLREDAESSDEENKWEQKKESVKNRLVEFEQIIEEE